MNTSTRMKRFAAIAGSALVGLMFATGANAANPEPVPVRVEWIAPAAIAENAEMGFPLGTLLDMIPSTDADIYKRITELIEAGILRFGCD